MKPIQVPERGAKDIDAATWRDLADDPETLHLIQRKIFSASIVAADRVRLHAACHVGRATLAGLEFEITEKIPGALAALLSFATHESFRVEKTPSPASDLGHLFELLAEQFVDSVYRYVSRGRQRTYATYRSTGSIVSGRLRIAETIRLRARGQAHRVAFERPFLSGVTNLNRVLAAALREINRLASAVKLSDRLLARSRGLSVLFSDCRDTELLFGRAAVFAALAERLEADPSHKQHADLLALARVILEHASFDPVKPTEKALPRSWFVNLEDLFEEAVRSVMRELAPVGWRVSKPARKEAPGIFHGGLNYRATPDLVIEDGTKAVLVGDVKYKDLDDGADDGAGGVPGQPDVYQLLVHASAFKSPTCFLVYPSDRFEERRLGAAATGQTTTCFLVDVRELRRDLKKAWGVMLP